MQSLQDDEEPKVLPPKVPVQKVQTIFLVMAMEHFHQDIWLNWIQKSENPSVHFLVHYKEDKKYLSTTQKVAKGKATNCPEHHTISNDKVTNYYKEAYNEWRHLIDVQFFLMDQALFLFQFEHCVFVSGTCVPICPYSVMVSQLQQYEGMSLLQYTPIPDSRVVCNFNPKPKMFEGPNWFILCYSHVNYLLKNVRSVPLNTTDKYAYEPCYNELSGVKILASDNEEEGTLPSNIDEYGICTILVRLFWKEIENIPVSDYIVVSESPHPVAFTESEKDMHFFGQFLRNKKLKGKEKKWSRYKLSDTWDWTPDENWQSRFFARKVTKNAGQKVLTILNTHWFPKPEGSNKKPKQSNDEQEVSEAHRFGKIIKHIQHAKSHVNKEKHELNTRQMQNECAAAYLDRREKHIRRAKELLKDFM